MTCGCHGTVNAPNRVEFCPLHASAPALRERLQDMSDDLNTAMDHMPIWTADQLRQHLIGMQAWAENLLSWIREQEMAKP